MGRELFVPARCPVKLLTDSECNDGSKSCGIQKPTIKQASLAKNLGKVAAMELALHILPGLIYGFSGGKNINFFGRNITHVKILLQAR